MNDRNDTFPPESWYKFESDALTSEDRAEFPLPLSSLVYISNTWGLWEGSERGSDEWRETEVKCCFKIYLFSQESKRGSQ